MSFLNPLMLLGITAISIPIVIHLLNKRKFQRVVWAAMRFLQVSVEQNQRRIQLEDILLLVLRCLMVALIALAMSRPLSCVQSGGGGLFGAARVTGVIILDHSYSMSHTDGVKSRMDLSRDAADAVLNRVPSGSAMALFLAGTGVETAIAEPTLDLNLVRKQVREAPLSHRASDLLPALRQAVDLLGSRPAARREIYVLTDRQRLAFANFQEIARLVEEHRKEIRIHFVLIDQPGDNNLGVTRLTLGAGIAALNRPLRFQVEVRNFGQTEARGVRVALRVNDDPPSDEAMIDTIAPGESRTLSMFARLRAEGFHAITATLPADRLPADDARSVALRAVTQVRVLLVDGDPGREPRDAETFFLRNALAPITPAEAESYFLKYDLITPAELDTARLDNYQSVFLCNVTDVSPGFIDALEGYLRRGGGLVFFPGDNTRADFFNQNLQLRRGILPAEMRAPVGDARHDERFFKLQDRDFEHEIAEVWRDPASGSPASAPVFRAYELAPDARSAAELDALTAAAADAGPQSIGVPRVVLRFDTAADNGGLAGKPFAIERAYGMGRVIQFASTADTAWTLLPTRPGVYLPLIQRALGAIVQNQDAALTVGVDETFVYHPDARTFPMLSSPLELIGKDAVVRPPDSEDSGREFRRITLENRLPTLRFESTPRAGVYDVAIVGEPRATLRFAVQADPGESSLAEISSEQTALLGELGQVTLWQPGAIIQDAVSAAESGFEWWTLLAIVAIAIATTETLLAHWFSHSK